MALLMLLKEYVKFSCNMKEKKKIPCKGAHLQISYEFIIIKQRKKSNIFIAIHVVAFENEMYTFVLSSYLVSIPSFQQWHFAIFINMAYNL